MSRTQRSFQSKHGHTTAIVVGIILVLLGLYFLIGLHDIKTGIVMILVGVAFAVAGFLIGKASKKE